MDFEHAISLGAWCQVSYQLRRHFPNTTASCFDWLVTPWPGLMKVMANGTDELGQSIIDNRWAKAAECTKYGILLPHEFPKNSNGEVVFSFKAAQQALEKLRHKHEKMLRTMRDCTGPVLFVRYGGNALPAAAWPYLPEPEPFDVQSLNNLCDLISTMFPALRFVLLFVYEGRTTRLLNEGTHLDQRIRVNVIHGDNDYSRWEGNDELWDWILEDAKEKSQKVINYGRSNVVRLHPA